MLKKVNNIYIIISECIYIQGGIENEKMDV